MTDRDDPRRDDAARDGELEFVHRDGETDTAPAVAAPDGGETAPAGAGDAAEAGVATFAVPRRRSGPPWVMIAAAVVIVAVAAWIFWPRGHGAPELMLDDQIPLVSADSSGTDSATITTAPAQPRSSDVNLGMAVMPIVPEKPAGDTRQASTPSPDRATETAAGSARASPAGGSPRHHPVLSPGPAGKWAVQVGAFGSRANADDLVKRLQAKGLRSERYRADTAGGTVWKVWIGYFPTREEAVRWLEKHRDEVGMATYITHR